MALWFVGVVTQVRRIAVPPILDQLLTWDSPMYLPWFQPNYSGVLSLISLAHLSKETKVFLQRFFFPKNIVWLKPKHFATPTFWLRACRVVLGAQLELLLSREHISTPTPVALPCPFRAHCLSCQKELRPWYISLYSDQWHRYKAQLSPSTGSRKACKCCMRACCVVWAVRYEGQTRSWFPFFLIQSRHSSRQPAAAVTHLFQMASNAGDHKEEQESFEFSSPLPWSIF